MATQEKETLQRRLKEAKRFVQIFNSSLPDLLDPANLHLRSYSHFKAIMLREVLLYRIAELSEVACEQYEKTRCVSAFIFTRSSLETSAMLYWLWLRIQESIRKDSLEGFRDEVKQMLYGTKGGYGPFKLESLQVLNLIDKMNRKFKGIRDGYDSLSEYVHPNFSGTLNSYAIPIKGSPCVEFRKVADEGRLIIGLPLLCIAQASFYFYYTAIGKALPSFAAICEKSSRRD